MADRLRIVKTKNPWIGIKLLTYSGVGDGEKGVGGDYYILPTFGVNISSLCAYLYYN